MNTLQRSNSVAVVTPSLFEEWAGLPSRSPEQDGPPTPFARLRAMAGGFGAGFLFLFLTLCLTGCDKEHEQGQANPAPEKSEPAKPQASGGHLDRILKSKVLRI